MSAPVGDIPLMIPEQSADDQKIVTALVAYKREADINRKSGLNPRDDRWRQNLDLYWNRHDFSNKAGWQSKNVMPEVPAYVDRYAAALKDALVSMPNDFYTVDDPIDLDNDITPAIKKMEDVWLDNIGRNQVGQMLDFSSVFEEQVKLGALMAMSGVVLWKDDVPGGRVAFESVDPRFVWFDHTYRNLYRIRRTEVDVVDVVRMGLQTSKRGQPIYNVGEISRLVGSRLADVQEQRELAGHGQDVISERKPIILDEFIASIVGDDGKLLMDNEVAIVADDEYLIRPPEKNPFWHGKDWLVYTPLMPVPMSPYGRSYMEDFGSVAKVFTDLTNLILDATYMASMKAYVAVPAMLKDPSQMNTGIWPQKVFTLEDGYSAQDFMKAIDLGSLDPASVQIWQNIKAELSDAAGMNEIGLGQLPGKTHIAATAVSGAQQSASAILRSTAQTIETRFLDPLLDLVWKTGLQHAGPDDMRMLNAVGQDYYRAIISDRKNIIKRPITFQARGISKMIQKQQRLQGILQLMQVIGGNPNLAQAFMQRIDMNKLIELLFTLSNVDIKSIEPTERQNLMNSIAQPLEEAAEGGVASQPGLDMMGDAASMMGVAAPGGGGIPMG